MRSLIGKIIIFMALISFGAMGFAFQAPALSERINDHAHMFSTQAISNISDKLAGIESKTSVQIAILTVNSLNGAVLEDAAIATANSWGLGQKDRHNGLLIFIAKQDRAIRVEVGAGLEAVLTDVRVGRIIDTVMIPNFKLEKYDFGIDAAINIVAQYIDPSFEVVSNNIIVTTKEIGNIPYKINVYRRIFIYLAIFGSMLTIAVINLKKAKKMLAMVVDKKILARKEATYDDFFPEEIAETQPNISNLNAMADNIIITKTQEKLTLLLFLYETMVWTHAIIVPIFTFEVWARMENALLMMFVFATIGYFIGKIIFLNKKITRYLPYYPEQTIGDIIFFGPGRSSGSSSRRFFGGGGRFRGGGASGRW